MESVATVGFGLLFVAALVLLGFWLVVLPLRLSKGLMHKWGYHAHCGLNCVEAQGAARLRELLTDEYKKGIRQGVRVVLQLGPEQSKAAVENFNLLPPWARNDTDAPLLDQVKAKYLRIAEITDATDNGSVWLGALSVAVGKLIAKSDDKEAMFKESQDMVLMFSGLSDDAPTVAGG